MTSKILAFLLLGAVLAALVAGCQAGTDALTGANRTQCMAYQQKLDSGLAVYFMEHDTVPASLGELAPDILDKVPTCPSGGTYSVYMDEVNGPRVSCSVHGKREITRQAQPGPTDPDNF